MVSSSEDGEGVAADHRRPRVVARGRDGAFRSDEANRGRRRGSAADRRDPLASTSAACSSKPKSSLEIRHARRGPVRHRARGRRGARREWRQGEPHRPAGSAGSRSKSDRWQPAVVSRPRGFHASVGDATPARALPARRHTHARSSTRARRTRTALADPPRARAFECTPVGRPPGFENPRGKQQQLPSRSRSRASFADGALDDAMAPTYSFPILGNNEIIACLGELDIPLTEQDLLRPHPDTLYRAYEEIVCLLCGQTREAMYAPDLEAADVLEFPELYEDAIGNLKFLRQLFELMRCCGVPDFTLKDLVKPEYTRTRRNISAVINFANPREEKVADYEETQAEHDAADKRLADAKKRTPSSRLRSPASRRARRGEGLRRASKALRDEWAAKAKDAEAERNVVAEQKAAVEQALAAVKANEDATKAKVLEAEAEMAALEAQLVKGPVATAELEALTRRCAEEQAKLDAETAKVKALGGQGGGDEGDSPGPAKLRVRG